MSIRAEKTNAGHYNYGLIGCGRFGRFCLEQLADWDRLHAVAITDIDQDSAIRLADNFNLTTSSRVDDLLARSDIDLVFISTPPYTHHSLTMKALQAKKHVICEKPVALVLAQADEMISTAKDAHLLLSVNHMLRYSPLLTVTKQIIEQHLLGEPLHYYFENYAEDERLPADHWFWDESKSGGIFVEHAVHFFDLYRWWFSTGKVIAAGSLTRSTDNIVDRVWCTMQHENGTLGTQYHGFDQPVRLDRAQHRIIFEQGEISITGWIPEALEITAIANQAQQDSLAGLCQPCQLTILESYTGGQRACSGRGKHYTVDAKINLKHCLAEDKSTIYGAMLKAFLEDQLRSLEDKTHSPLLTAMDGRNALMTAVEASLMCGTA